MIHYWISINLDCTLKAYLIIPSEDPHATLPFNAFEVTETQFLNMRDNGYLWKNDDAVEPPVILPPEPPVIPPIPPVVPEDPCDCPPDPETETGLTWEDILAIYAAYEIQEYWVSINVDGSLKAYLLIPSEDPHATLPFNAFEVTPEQFAKLLAGYVWQDGDAVVPPPDVEVIGGIEDALEDMSAEELLEMFKGMLKRCIGCRVYTEENYVTSGENVTQSIDALDIAIGNAAAKIPSVIDLLVDPISTTDVSTTAQAGVKTIKWIVTVEDLTNIKARSFEILAMNNLGAGVDYTTYGMIGDWHIQYSVSVELDSGNMVLRFINNENHSLRVSFSTIITK